MPLWPLPFEVLPLPLLLPAHPVTLCKEDKIGPGGEERLLDRT